MKIFICGQKSFGLAVMKRLYEDGHEIVGAAPPPQERLKDKMVGFAVLHKIPLISDCDDLVSDNIPEGTELIVSAHSHWIISEKAIEKCLYGGIGFHPSLLPRHRGQDAVRWTVAMGDPIGGGTVYRLNDKCDGGEVLLQRFVFIDKSWDYHDLWARLFPIGVDMVSEAVKAIERGKAEYEPQDERFATWEPSWERPRLKRNELLQLGGVNSSPAECAGCVRDCEYCTMHISDPLRYNRGPA